MSNSNTTTTPDSVTMTPGTTTADGTVLTTTTGTNIEYLPSVSNTVYTMVPSEADGLRCHKKNLELLQTDKETLALWLTSSDPAEREKAQLIMELNGYEAEVK